MKRGDGKEKGETHEEITKFFLKRQIPFPCEASGWCFLPHTQNVTVNDSRDFFLPDPTCVSQHQGDCGIAWDQLLLIARGGGDPRKINSSFLTGNQRFLI